MTRHFLSLTSVIAMLLVIIGGYLLLNSTAPLWSSTFSSHDGRLAKSTPVSIAQAIVYIPKIGVKIPYAAGSADVLEHGAWWRSPASGNPKDGGNFVLAAHRFEMGWTPMQTARKSPLYHAEKLAVGDKIIVDYEGVRYDYEITNVHRVAPSATEIEAPTGDRRLTLYTCTLGGSSDGRDVIVAKQR